MAPQAMPYLAESRQDRGAPNPDLPGRTLFFGTLTLLKISSPVAEARKDHLL